MIRLGERNGRVIAGPLVGVQWRDLQVDRDLDRTLLSIIRQAHRGPNFMELRYLLSGGFFEPNETDREIEESLDRLASMRLIHCPDGGWRML